MVSLDSYMDDNGLDRVDVVKVDVETMEHVVLAGARAMLERHRPVVFMEVLGPAQAEALQQLVAEAEYVSAALDERELRVHDGVVADPDNTNQMLWPREAQGRLEAIAGALGITVSGRVDATQLAGSRAP